KDTFKSQQYDAIIKETQWPIIYSPEYNIAFCGLERLHPFDAGKWGRIFQYLKDAGMVRDDTIVEPEEATEQELLVVHTEQYLRELRWSMNVAAITEVPPVALLPNFIVQRKVLRPFRYQTSGTIMAGRLALERGWAINIGGGFHHCSAKRGGGFCAYADITLCIKFAFEKLEGVARAMIIDLDAHQGNGHERDFMNDERVFILDVYNRSIYPHDGYAKRAIARKVELAPYTGDGPYLESVRRHVEGALNQFDPHLVVYNAGTDILYGDPLGCLSISAQGIIERDQIVFQKCRTRGIPVLMVTSGGYQHQTARIVADSVLNLYNLRLISCDEAENAPLPELPRRGLSEAGGTLSHSRSDGGLFARFRRSCMSRSSSSTNSISSLNSPCATGVGMSENTNVSAAKTLSTGQPEQTASVPPLHSAFGVVECQDSTIVEGQKGQRPTSNTNTPAIASEMLAVEVAHQSGTELANSATDSQKQQSCTTENLEAQEKPVFRLDSKEKEEFEFACEDKTEVAMNLLEALSVLKQVDLTDMVTETHIETSTKGSVTAGEDTSSFEML
ncbi:histone deacetylase 11, partial [Elysia marginata]